MSKQRVYILALAVWFAFLALAVAMGALRELLVTPAIGVQGAHVAGTLAFLAAMLGIMFLFVRHTRRHCGPADLWLIGLSWLTLTVAFEFLFFHYVEGKPWNVLFEDYDLLNGRIWVLVPLTELFGPPILGFLVRHRS